jgi:hypothetical protein
VTYSVLKAANCCDAEEFNPNKLLETAAIAETALENGEYEKAYTITLKDRQEIYDREYNELMKLSKHELVVKLIGYKPVW